MSNTTTTAAIRAALKDAGFNARQVTVKDRSYGDIKVTVRDVSVPLSTVKEIAGQFENVRRCESSGEILCGGNTFISTRYADDVLVPVAEVIEALIMATEFGFLVQLAGGYSVTVEHKGSFRGERVYAHGPGLGYGDQLSCHGIRHAANQIAAAYLDSRALAVLSAAKEAA